MTQSIHTVERIYKLARIIKAGTEALGEKPDMEFCYKSGTR